MTDEPQAPPARIQRIEVTGLFGLYDHVIDLKLEDRVTILHGPNGVGKTVLLRMIQALVTGDLQALVQIPFVHFRLTMIDGTSFSVRTSPRTIKRHTREEKARILTLSAERDGAEILPPAELAFFRERRTPTFQFFFGATGASEADARTVELFQGEQWHEDPRFSEPGAVLTALAHLPVRVIGVERLIEAPAERSEESDDATSLPAIWGCSIDLKHRIARDWISYGELAQQLDRSYPRRLLGHKAPAITVDELKRRMTALEQKREELRAIGLLDEERVPSFDLSALDNLDPTQMGVMTLYAEDTARKLGALDDLVERLSLLLRTANARFRNKSVRADPRQGLALSAQDRPLDLRALSSGEQHQLVMLYNLLFRVPAGALVLIDEPELSLHVLWQKRFLPTLLEIVRIAGIDALVATHSPFIVGERSDLMVALDAEIDHDGPVQP